MKKKRRWPWIVLAVVVLISIGVAVFYTYTNDQLNKLAKVDIEDVDLSTINDGTYHGKYGSFPVAVELDVTINAHKITKIIITKHDNGQGKPAEAIIDDVIEAQSLQVDVITGATYSSKTILIALQNALNP